MVRGASVDSPTTRQQFTKRKYPDDFAKFMFHRQEIDTGLARMPFEIELFPVGLVDGRPNQRVIITHCLFWYELDTSAYVPCGDANRNTRPSLSKFDTIPVCYNPLYLARDQKC